MVFYRKYRPQTISELDLDEVRAKLTNILGAKELPHAFLFTGPKGLGKTSAARILAKAINCENKKGIEPCNKCDACTSITNGSNIDVLEIDAASNRGIDEIRDLREKIKFSPASLQKKVYIIDEVHMLTTDAFNALLKTLEEPPLHALFILCTTEEDKVPGTIKSRTFHVEFKKPKKEELVRSLARIIEGEKIDVDKDVPDIIYKLSEGSFRDGAKILEELSFTGGKITKEDLESKFKTGSIDNHVAKLLEALSRKDVREALDIINNLSEKGADFKYVTEKIAEVLHKSLLRKTGIETESSDFPALETQEIRKLLNLVNDSYRNIKFSVLPQIPLELVVVEFCLKENLLNQAVAPTPPSVGSNSTKQEVGDTKQPAPLHEGRPAKTEKAETSKSERQIAKSEHGMFKEGAVEEHFFAALISRVKQDNHSIAGILRGCRLIGFVGDKVEFETAYKFHRDKLNDPKIRGILDVRSSELLSRDVNVIVKLVEKKV